MTEILNSDGSNDSEDADMILSNSKKIHLEVRVDYYCSRSYARSFPFFLQPSCLLVETMPIMILGNTTT